MAEISAKCSRATYIVRFAMLLTRMVAVDALEFGAVEYAGLEVVGLLDVYDEGVFAGQGKLNGL